MRHRSLLFLVCSPLVACASTAAVQSDGGAADAGPSADAAPRCPDAGLDPAIADAGAPTGAQLQAGDELSIRGVTSDGFVIYSDDAAHALHAIALSGGPVQDLGALGKKYWVTSSGDVVFIWPSVNDANVSPFATWSSKNGLHTISAASAGLVATKSSTEQRMLYLDAVDASGNKGDIYVAATDGSGATRLIAGAYVAGCSPQLTFAGSYAIATHCDAAPGATPSAIVSSFSTSNWTRVDLATNAENYFWATATADSVLVSTSAGVLAAPLAGGPATTIDATGFLGVLTGDGKTALYSTKTHGLRRSLLAAPSPTTLVTSGFGGLWSLSPDEKWVLYFENLGSNGGDIFFASAVAPNAPLTLSAAPTGALHGDSFTASSTHVLFSSEVDACTDVGKFQALAVGSTSPQVLGQRVWVDWALGASKVVFNDNFFPTGGLRFGRADVEWLDLASGSTPTRLVDRADAVIGLSPAGDRLVYAWSLEPGPRSGLYVVPLPAGTP